MQQLLAVATVIIIAAAITIKAITEMATILDTTIQVILATDMRQHTIQVRPIRVQPITEIITAAGIITAIVARASVSA